MNAIQLWMILIGSSAAFAGAWVVYAIISTLPADLFMHIGLTAVVIWCVWASWTKD